MSVVDKRELGLILRRLRNERGLTVAKVIAELAGLDVEISPSTLTQWEAGKRAPRPQDLQPLMKFYEVDGTDVNGVNLFGLARLARQRNWWSQSAGALRGSFTTLLGLESEAVEIREYTATVLPGLVQIPDYARAVMLSNVPRPSDETVAKRLEVRLQRQQQVLGEDTRLRALHLILDEGCVRRMVGGETVWRDQLRHLLRVAEQPLITLQVVPFVVGSHAGTLGSFTIMTFPDAPMISAVELAGTDLSEEGTDAEPYNARFDKLREQALPAPMSLALIHQVANEKG